jgi:hypothetical protein
MKKLRAPLAYGVLAGAIGCAADVPEVPGPDYLRQAPLLELKLAAHGEQRRDRIVVRATVINRTDSPISWDREFSAHLRWSISGDQEDSVHVEQVADLDKPPPTEFANRFVRVPPRGSLSHDFELTYLLRESISGHSTSASEHSTTHKSTFREVITRSEIDPRCQFVNLRLTYGVDGIAWDAFKSWFGHSVDELSLPGGGVVASEQLQIRFPNP